MSARTILKHLHQQGRMTDYQFDVINRNLKERPQGEWIILDSGDRACPFCNMGMSRESNSSLVFFNYCPFCGADMRVKGGKE